MHGLTVLVKTDFMGARRNEIENSVHNLFSPSSRTKQVNFYFFYFFLICGGLDDNALEFLSNISHRSCLQSNPLDNNSIASYNYGIFM